VLLAGGHPRIKLENPAATQIKIPFRNRMPMKNLLVFAHRFASKIAIKFSHYTGREVRSHSEFGLGMIQELDKTGGRRSFIAGSKSATMRRP
jgi:hypothetical protein